MRAADDTHAATAESVKPPNQPAAVPISKESRFVGCRLHTCPARMAAPSPDKTHGTPCAAGRCAPTHCHEQTQNSCSVSYSENCPMQAEVSTPHQQCCAHTHTSPSPTLTAATSRQTRTGHTPAPPTTSVATLTQPTTQHTYTISAAPLSVPTPAPPPPTAPNTLDHTPPTQIRMHCRQHQQAQQQRCSSPAASTRRTTAEPPRCLCTFKPPQPVPCGTPAAPGGLQQYWIHQMGTPDHHLPQWTLHGRHKILLLALHAGRLTGTAPDRCWSG